MAADDGEGNHVVHEHSSGLHFLVVSYGLQSHVNPGRVLAQRLARLGGGVTNNGGSILATLSVPVATHRRMFPSLAGAADETTTTDGVISYVPYSNGFDDGSTPKSPKEWDRSCRATSRSLSALLARFAAGGRPVTCVVCTLVVPGVLDVVREHGRHGVPLAVYWIQPATVLATYYHYFHGYGELIADAAHAMDPTYEVSLPELGRHCRLRVRDLPSFLVDSHTDNAETTNKFPQELYEYMDQWRPRVLVNTSYELEADALMEMERHLDIFPIRPVVRTSSAVEDPPAQIHLFKHDNVDKKRYMDWLGAHRDKTVVYVSFGSVTKCTKLQMEEVVRGLRQCGRPHLLVVRKDGLEEEDDDGLQLQEVSTQDDEMGMVVDWCDQLEVLSHPAVGCFVTHCGWNSTLEAVVSGVPIVGVPKTFDQPTNMYLMEVEWTTGVRGECDSEGVLTGTELARCIKMVMGEGTQAMAMRERAGAMKEMARERADAGGLAERKLRDFVKTFQAHERDGT
ncbi:hypothetical protein BS78_08G005800 [Paspalum vaginatum]|nr:hypothetical protein BS78_08G005800 [Paspalum vaginatum]